MTPDPIEPVIAERQAQRAATYTRRRTRRLQSRQLLAAARAIGLQRRHANKTTVPTGTDEERTTP